MTFKKKSKFYLILFLMIFSLLLPQIGKYSMNNIKSKQYFYPTTTKNWTFMLYLCADTRDHLVTSSLDNNNNSIGEAIMNCLTQVSWYDILPGSESNINIVALLDHPYEFAHPYGYGEYLDVQYGVTVTLVDLGTTNMGSYYTLRDFINYCKTNYPANNYALLISDHGRGYAGFAYDYHASHPSWEYALGDCLTVEELSDALSNTGGVDVLFLNTCLGGSFEVMWQLYSLADIVIAGETIQVGWVLYHPRDVLYHLTRDTTLTSIELAQLAFECGQDPELMPLYPYSDQSWKCIGVYDLTKFPGAVTTGGTNLFEVFEDFTDILLDEFNHDASRARTLFRNIRGNLTYLESLFASNSMMVDLKHFVEECLSRSDEFYNQVYLENYATTLINLLSPQHGKLLYDHWTRPYSTYDNINGFSICFPNTLEMYQEYLYANFYEDLDISVDTNWDDFIFSVYPEPFDPWFDMHIPEFYEVHLGPIDPSIDLHIFIDELAQFPEELHIGHTGEFNDYSMDVELGLPGAEFVDDLLWGTQTILLPVSNLMASTRADSDLIPDFKVVVNATGAASASRDVNLTVRHVKDNEVIWEENQISSIEVGQDLTCDITTDDNWTDLEEIPKEKTAFIGPSKEIIEPIIYISFTIMVLITFRRRQRNK